MEYIDQLAFKLFIPVSNQYKSFVIYLKFSIYLKGSRSIQSQVYKLTLCVSVSLREVMSTTL